MHEVDAVVVGAGAAGLAAAQRIRAAGRAVRVLEARSRAGGRAWTLHVNFSAAEQHGNGRDKPGHDVAAPYVPSGRAVPLIAAT